MMEFLLKDCDCIIGRTFNITERPEDKFNDHSHAISKVEKTTWKWLLNVFQIQDFFQHEGGPRFSWSNGQRDNSRKLARLDRFYTSIQS